MHVITLLNFDDESQVSLLNRSSPCRPIPSQPFNVSGFQCTGDKARFSCECVCTGIYEGVCGVYVNVHVSAACCSLLLNPAVRKIIVELFMDC